MKMVAAMCYQQGIHIIYGRKANLRIALKSWRE